MSLKALLLISIVATMGWQEVFGDPIGVVSNPCVGEPDGYFVRDLNDCQAYHYCFNGTTASNKCPGDFYYNELEQLCDYQDKVMCHICSEKLGVQILPHPQDCTQFITCSEGVSFVSRCAEGYAFDRQKKVCNPVERVKCEQELCPEEDDPNEIVFLPGVERCDEYFICRAGTAIQALCAPGLYWDAGKKRCDLMANVSCTLY
ncbi:peritrophin-44-like [Anopheles marshallii]|uniref:peritrophin-44-like n=1 Tax=Anopheles marshallii TaxID=1521116 RepID=UPI00237AED97|nr:peritrophin-44-like [Anopheles marshallii]